MRAIFAAFAMGLLVGAVHAGPFEDGAAAYSRGDYATAIRLWRPLAEQGDARAHFSLGIMYNFGHGALRDYAKALTWYRLATDHTDGK